MDYKRIADKYIPQDSFEPGAGVAGQSIDRGREDVSADDAREIRAWAIRAPNGKIITWTCFEICPEHSWLHYCDVERMTPAVERIIEKKKETGYSVVRVRIIPDTGEH